MYVFTYTLFPSLCWLFYTVPRWRPCWWPRWPCRLGGDADSICLFWYVTLCLPLFIQILFIILFLQMFSPGLCGPNWVTWGTRSWSSWLIDYRKSSLVPGQMVRHSPTSTALKVGVPGLPRFRRSQSYQLLQLTLPYTCLVSFKLLLLQPLSRQPYIASVGLMKLLDLSPQLVTPFHRRYWNQQSRGWCIRLPKSCLSQHIFC